MKRRIALIGAAILFALTIMFSPTAANATQSGPEDTVEIVWLMPEGGSPSNVTWPQTLAPDGAIPCGRYGQADTYLRSEAERFTADGMLYLGEDYGNDTQRGAISWHFPYGGDCPPPQPEDGISQTISLPTYDCEARIVSVLTTTSTTPFIWDGKEWVPGETTTTDHTDYRDATAEECPVVVPPIDEPPVVTPEPPVTTLTAPEPVAEELAQTGPVEDIQQVLITVGVGFFIFIAGFVLFISTYRTRRLQG